MPSRNSEADSLDAVGPDSPARATPVLSRAMGRPSGYSQEMAGRLCELIRRRGIPDTTAGKMLGIAASTLAGWKREHPDLGDWLAMAREQFRESMLAIVDEAKTKDGRPDWRAAAWALEKAFPEDYGKAARPRRERADDAADFEASAAILERAFPGEFGGPAMAGRPHGDLEAFGAGSGPSGQGPAAMPEVPAAAREMIAVLLEDNEALRAQLNDLLAEK